MMLIKVIGKSAAPIPNRKSDDATFDEVEWNNVTSKNDTDMIAILGTSNFVLSLCLLANITPNTGPNANTANDRGSCNKPT